MKLVDMKHTEEEREEESEEAKEQEGPAYPYGLKISLGKDELEKLGMDENPYSGSEFTLEAKCKVVEEGENSSDDGYDSRHVCLQIMELGLEPEENEPPTYRRRRH